MTKTLASKLIVPMAMIVLLAAILASWTLSGVEARHDQEAAQNELAGAQANLLDLLTVTQGELVSKLDGEMRVLQAEARRLGLPSRGGQVRAGAGMAPDLRFGPASQARLMDLVEQVRLANDQVITLFSLRGQEFVRLSTTAFQPDGTRAAGTVLDPASGASRALVQGRAYWGPAVVFGNRGYTYYEPVRSASGAVVGAFGLGVPLHDFSRIYQAVRRTRILERGFLALVDPDGHPLFAGGTLSPAAIRAVYQHSRADGETWSARRQVFGPWGIVILAAYPVKELESAVWLIRGAALGIALLLVGALTLSHYWVLRKNLLRPLSDVLGILDAISQFERFEIRFRPTQEGEIGALTASLNGMLDEIQARDRKLRDYQEHLEDLVAQRYDQLRETQQLLASTLDALPAAIAILDGQGTILEASRQWVLLTASGNPLMAGAAVGTAYLPTCRALQSQPGEIGTVAARVAQVIQGERASASLDYGLDLDRRHQWHSILATRFGTPEQPRIVVMQLNVTEQRLLEIQLRQAQKLESIGQLAAGIAHEINTPTQYIGDNAVFLRGAFQDLWNLIGAVRSQLAAGDETSCPPERIAGARAALDQADLAFYEGEIPRALHETLEGVRRVSTIVSAMKDFSHPGESRKIPTDLNRAIESTVLVCRGEWKYVAEVELDLAPELPLVPCLPDEFNQVVLNLIINAAHAIAEAGRGEKGRIRIGTRSDGAQVRITVADTGAGIPDAIRTRIFDPFFTTKPVGKGTGQGLAIAHAVIVEQHGGSITLETEEGVGTTFTLRLPLEPTAAPARDTGSGPRQRPGHPRA